MTSRTKFLNLWRAQLFVAIALIAGVIAATSSVTFAATEDGLRSRIQALYELFLRRPLAKRELQKIVEENAADYASLDEEARGNFDRFIDVLRNKRGTPMELHARNVLIKSAYFDEDRDALGRALLLSVDPVVVVNEKHEEVMTRGDVLAFVQILKFHDTGHDPRKIEKTRNEKDNELAAKLTIELKAIAEKGSAFPEMLLHTSALWTGLVQHWASLTAEQKKSARFYIATSLNGTLVDMPDALYAKLMGWSKDEITMATLHRNYKVIMMMHGLQNRMLGMQQLYNAWYYGLRE